MNSRYFCLILCLTASSMFAVPAFSIVYVDQNSPGPAHDGTAWDTAFLTIQEGVGAATPGGEVWVADGVYVENVAMGEGVQLYGGFLGAEPGGYEASLDQRDFANNVATIDGNQSGSCVVMAVDTRVDGFTLTNGSGTPHGEQNAPHGGAVYCNGIGESGVIANNQIVENSAWYGGAILVFESAPTIESNTIARNNAACGRGGGIFCERASPTIMGNSIRQNVAAERGGGVYFWDSSATLTGNEITGNVVTGTFDDGGGVYCAKESSIELRGNLIAQNEAGGEGGGVCCGDTQATVIGNVVCANGGRGSARPEGGGLFFAGCSLYVAGNVIAENDGSWGGGLSVNWSTGVVKGNVIWGNTAPGGGGGINLRMDPSPTVACNAITGNSAYDGGGVSCGYTDPFGLTSNTIVGNSASRYGGGIRSAFSDPRIANNIVVGNIASEAGGGIYREGGAPQLRFNDVSANSPDDYYGCQPGGGDISTDPLFVDPGAGNWHLSFGSPCIDAGYNNAPGMPETDWEGEDRIANGVVDIGADECVTWITSAPDPQPESGGGLFGMPQGGFPGWVWFGIPITPAGGDWPEDVLGVNCRGKLFRFDSYDKTISQYQGQWRLSVGEGYIFYMDGALPSPSYEGISPFTPWEFEHKLGRQGWTWIGMPGLTELGGQEFLSTVKVKYPSDDTGCYRTGAQDHEAIPDDWIAWGWPYWNTWLKCMEVFTPYAPFGHRTCYPWLGYRCWVQVGTAQTEDDPDQVTLVWPKGQ